jgi:response regulator RpfG family c-di-GMP phosphodiesterase
MDRIKVILVDNDPDELFFMKRGFESSKLYEIIGQFSGGDDVMKYLYESKRLPDLVITDLNMPGKSGIEIAREITLNPRLTFIKVIVLSLAFGNNDFSLKQSGRGGSPFLFQKPSSLLEYQSFAMKLYEKIHADFIQR